MQYPVTDKFPASSVRCGVKFSYIVKREEKASSTGGMLQHIKYKQTEVYETIMETNSLSATIKEDGPLRWPVRVVKYIM